MRCVIHTFFFAVLLFAASSSYAWIPHGGASPPPGNWYDPAWSFRKQITIDHTKVSSSGGETYAGFSVLVSEATDAGLSAHALNTGYDILFTSSDGVTKLNHEIEKYISASGNIVAWVRVGGLSTSVDTVLFMYYGNPSASNQQNPAGTWDSHYKGVYHLASSNIPFTLSRYAGNPVINYGGGGWKDSQVYDFNTIPDPADSTKVLMYYTGMAAPVQFGKECIGMATVPVSTPFVWTEYASNPVICDGQSHRVDAVIYNGGTYYLYSTNDNTQDIELWTSSDQVTFTKIGNVLTPSGDETKVSQGAVWVEGGVWTMIYAYHTASATLPGYRYATSSTGLPGSWTKGGVDILSTGIPGSTDSTYMEFHSIRKTGLIYNLSYECFNGTTYWICNASSASLTSGWVKNGAIPTFQQSKAVGTFDVCHVATPAFSNIGGTEYLLYSGGNLCPDYNVAKWAMGMATLSGQTNTLIDLVSTTITDSTSANSLSGTAMTASTGQIDGAFTFDGISGHAASLAAASNATDNYTIQAWMRPASLSQAGFAVHNGYNNAVDHGAGIGFGIAASDGSGNPGNELMGEAPGVAWMDSGFAFANTTTKRSINMVRSSGTTTWWVDGSTTGGTSSATPLAATQSFTIGSQTGVNEFSGDIDEVRFSDVVRSSGWLTTEYANENAPASFYTVGPEVPY